MFQWELRAGRGKLTTFSADADIPAVLGTGALEMSGEKLDFRHSRLHLGNLGVEVLF